MTFKAMLLDANDVLLAVETLESEAQLTARHVDLRPHGGDCDRAPLEYRWDRARATLLPLAPHQRPRIARGVAVSLDAAFYADLKARVAAGAALPADAAAWLIAYEQSLDAQGR